MTTRYDTPEARAAVAEESRPARRLPTTLTDEETSALIAKISPRGPLGLRNRAILAAVLGAGLRVSEVVALTPADINYTDGVVRVKGSTDGRDRVIPVDGETLAWLSAWAEKRKALGMNNRQPYFCRVRTKGVGTERLPAGQPISTRNVQALLARLARETGLQKRVTPHTLRHTYASRLLERGFTLGEVQQLLGQSAPAATMVYTQVNPAALKAKVQNHDSRADLAAQIAALEEQLAEIRKAAGLSEPVARTSAPPQA
jgi:site-specific recombinase XerD